MEVLISNFREHRNNTLQGFFDVKITNLCLEIRGCCLHEKDGRKWVQLPSKPYEKEDGSKGWQYILDFYDRDKREAFQKDVLNAIRDTKDEDIF
jgi:hypothetical protein